MKSNEARSYHRLSKETRRMTDERHRTGEERRGKCKLLVPSNPVISSGLAIGFTDDVVIRRNRAPSARVYPNFRIVLLVLAWHGPNLFFSLPHVKFYVSF